MAEAWRIDSMTPELASLREPTARLIEDGIVTYEPEESAISRLLKVS